MLTQYITQYYFNGPDKVQFLKHSIKSKKVLIKHKLFFTMVKPPFNDQDALNIKPNILKNNMSYLENFANKKLISRSFMVQLINIYWQETIFLSRSNALSNTYANQLKSDGIAIYKNQYKKFLLDFSKALVTSRIEVSLDDNDKEKNTESEFNSAEIKYIWKKGLNFLLPKPRYLLNFISFNNKFKYLNTAQKCLCNELKNSKFPVFTIVNKLNQIVVAEPSEKLITNTSPFDQLYQWYYNNFLWTEYRKPSYNALFFINPEDAIEYKEYIQHIYEPINKNTMINLFASRLDFYYKLLITSHPKVKLTLIPDLKELGKLIYEYQYEKNISFHDKQIYSRSSFKGQPIYFIQPVLVKHKYTKKMEMLDYNYILELKYQGKHRKTIFMNYKVALLAWNIFKQQNVNYYLPDKPQILVYNLEDFFKTYNDKKTNINNHLLLVPNEDAYRLLKSNLSLNSSNSMHMRFKNKLIHYKTFINHIIWSLTSRQPVSL
uniref:Uncharacterized protein n=1 Tax=Betaphycus gelatinus TaxID=1191690 RepID=A0A8E7PFT8_9FLOR|nr:hypothetical protein [Betaphycus gelatinus]